MATLFQRVQQALIPDYELERELGAGGMGVVFVAWEPALKRRVAVKVLRPELATATAAERFRREAEALARAAHPNVVTIHKASERGGISFLVMELFDSTLAARLAGGPLPERDALRLGRRLLEGLGQVHHLGIVHRDIKPGNVFFRGDDPVLGDFGIAKQRASGDETLTGTDPQPGTPAYMAPEQLAGRDITPAADLYAAGALLYETLTARRWPGVGEVRRADWSGIRTPVIRVLQRALAYDPAERWPDAGAFARALRAAGRSLGKRTALGVSALTIATILAAIVLRPNGDRREPGPAAPAQVAVLPLRSDPADSSVALRVAHAVSLHLENAFGDGGLRVVPIGHVARWWTRAAPPESVPSLAFTDLHTERIVWGGLEREGPGYRAVIELSEPHRPTRSVASHFFQPGTEMEAGLTLAYHVVRDLEPRRGFEFTGSPLANRNNAAVDSLMAGDWAFWRENWGLAERRYRAAIALDSTLGWAWWGLYNVERWRRGGFDVDLRRVQALYPPGFRALDPLLIAADLEIGPRRLTGYQAAIAEYPHHASPWLLLGNELFHRGPLWGVRLDSAAAVLRVAGARDPFLAPAFSTLAWALIRLGRERESRDALDRYSALASGFTEQEFCLRCVLELAWTARFAPRELPVRLGEFLGETGPSGSLARSVRWGLSFGVPEGQVLVSGLMADAAASPEQRADALAGRALGLVALGRMRAALADLDSSARLTSSAELALLAAEWRVVLPALGIPGMDSVEQATGRDFLARWEAGDDVGTGRARWALALDRFAAGDVAGGRRWAALLDPRDPEAAGLRELADAFDAAARGDTAEALRRTDPASGFTIAHERRLGDPLARAALYLSRGAWLETAHPAAADRAWLWYQNSDAAGWPGGPPQAAEIDWALESWGRYRRATLAAALDDGATACPLLLDVANRWERAEPAYVQARARVAQLLARCGG
jgi:tRNA A-37 threonylcarbamoyl transferase component Bud32